MSSAVAEVQKRDREELKRNTCPTCCRPLNDNLQEILRYNDFILNSTLGILSYKDKTARLTKTKTLLLTRLFKAQGGVVLHEQLAIATLGMNYYELNDPTGNLKVHVCKLKKAIRKSEIPLEIDIVWGKGYYVQKEVTMV